MGSHGSARNHIHKVFSYLEIDETEPLQNTQENNLKKRNQCVGIANKNMELLTILEYKLFHKQSVLCCLI